MTSDGFLRLVSANQLHRCHHHHRKYYSAPSVQAEAFAVVGAAVRDDGQLDEQEHDHERDANLDGLVGQLNNNNK